MLTVIPPVFLLDSISFMYISEIFPLYFFRTLYLPVFFILSLFLESLFYCLLYLYILSQFLNCFPVSLPDSLLGWSV